MVHGLMAYLKGYLFRFFYPKKKMLVEGVYYLKGDSLIFGVNW